MIIVAATLKAKPGKRDEVIALAQDCIAATRQEKGCISYTLYSSTEDDVTLFFFEQWENPECLINHSGSAHFKSFGVAKKPLTEGSFRIKLYEASETSL